MRILLTGGGGMVGQNILEHESASEHEILAPPRSELDLLDRSKIDAYLENFSPDFVIHAAGRVGGIRANIASPLEFLVENLNMALNLFESAHATGILRLINLASSCMYPRFATNPLREEMLLSGELEPTNEGYALAKIVSTRHCTYLSQNGGDARYKTLIPCNLFGRHDNFDPISGHMIPGVINRMSMAKKENMDSIEAWGDGTARREFMLASDLADFVFYALSNFDDLPLVMNVGVGQDHSIADYYRAIASTIGFEGTLKFDTTKPVGMHRKLLDISEQKKLGWKPAKSLQEGLKEAYHYFNQRKMI